ncbi:MAG: hypothetical protein JWM31_48 [Solirubrobacterales bacterium]|nr:hypothetical protein [Solirubrobacterales bacterium]
MTHRLPKIAGVGFRASEAALAIAAADRLLLPLGNVARPRGGTDLFQGSDCASRASAGERAKQLSIGERSDVSGVPVGFLTVG